MTNEISWRHRNPSNPNRPAEPGRTEFLFSQLQDCYEISVDLASPAAE